MTLLEIRQALMLTQKEFAESIGVCEMTYRRIEKGYCRPSMKTKRAITEFLVKKGYDGGVKWL